MAAETDNIVLYTNHICPWAHRAHIALAELNIPFKEEIIDLSTPRTADYLKINPRGLVPSLSYNNQIITESAVVSTFLADLAPNHLVPAVPSDAKAALFRARVNFFVDTYFSKVNSFYTKSRDAKSDEEANAFGVEYAKAVVKEIEPLLADANPYFGGSDKITLAEVLTASFVSRAFTLVQRGVLPKTLLEGLPEKAPKFYAWGQELVKHPSVLSAFPEERIVAGAEAKVKNSRRQAQI